MKNWIGFLAMMLVFSGFVLGAPITTDKTECVTAPDGGMTCGYFGTYKDKNIQIGIEMGLNWIEGSKTTFSVDNAYVGGYAYSVNFGSSWNTSVSTSLNERRVVGFFNDMEGQASEWRSNNSVKSVTTNISKSSWDCTVPTACRDKGIWESFTTEFFFGKGWWKSYSAGVEVGNDNWEYSNVIFTHNSGAWDNVIDSTGGGGSPTPEPATYAMMGLGLAALGFISRRKEK